MQMGELKADKRWRGRKAERKKKKKKSAKEVMILGLSDVTS